MVCVRGLNCHVKPNGKEDREITVKRERTITQKESLVVKSKRGTGTNDRDEIRKEVVREADLDVPDGAMDQFPNLIGREAEGDTVGQVVETMQEIRESSNAE